MQDDTSNGYIFISHSHKDIEKVREIRNEMEAAGFDPLCFYLKCLTDEDELEELIKREINARELFAFIDSPNSRKSKWVKKEREYIDSLKNKRTVTIKLENYGSMEEIADKLIRGLRVYISYSHRDYTIASAIAEKLRQKEFQVLMDESITFGSDYDSKIAGMIEDASQAGAFLVIITENSMKSENLIRELDYAMSIKSLILPVYVGDVELTGKLRIHLGPIQSIFIKDPLEGDEEDFDRSMDHIADEVWRALERMI